MIAEPYICIKGQHQGVIEWTMSPHGMVTPSDRSESWKPYADFEREKLKELKGRLWYPERECEGAFAIEYRNGAGTFYSAGVTNYCLSEYLNDSESNRLLKRAEFLKAVCQKEGVEFLPKEKCCEQTYSTFCDNCDSRGEYCAKECTCPCHKKPEKCCKGFELDGVLFHECKEHRPYCAKDWPCFCKPEKLCTCIEDMGPMSCQKHTPVVSDEREWRKAFLDKWLEFARRTTRAKDAQALKDIEELRKRFT